ncbi:ParB N-terminal domain-containing protein [Streptomyces sp. NPDC059193]|uniref:ParB N-terminal domain-containing protein n=1 Tax=Streptomyces sp. NPDC059193 TaxID=3346763 RepID=UPI00367FAEFB
MSKTTTAPVTWPTIPLADLLAHNTLAETADPAMAEAVATGGITEPLYVATTENGTVRVIDGMRRLAAAAAVQLAEVPVTYRPLLRVDALTAHPGNVRKSLKISKEFTASIQAEGIRTPVLVTRTSGGELRVIDGHRRLAAAVAVKLTHVPYTYEERDDAGQWLDMVTTARHREGLTTAEETNALFEAAAVGADACRIAAAAGTTQAQAKKMIKVAESSAVRAAAAAQLGNRQPLTLDAMATLAELEKADPAAAQRLTKDIADTPRADHSWMIARAAKSLATQREAEAHRAELEAAGARIRTLAEMSEHAAPVAHLPISKDAHAECQGHVWVMEEGQAQLTPYCANPPFHGHAPSTSAKPSASERRAIIEGGKDWDTAEEIRRKWLATLIGRARHPKAVTDQLTQITARVLLSGADVLISRRPHPDTDRMLRDWLGQPHHASDAAMADRADKAPTRNAMHAFAAIAASYEKNTTRTVWRTDGDHARAEIRKRAAEWLGWLVTLGYEPSPIEQAVIDMAAYNPAAQALKTSETQGDTLTS